MFGHSLAVIINNEIDTFLQFCVMHGVGLQPHLTPPPPLPPPPPRPARQRWRPCWRACSCASSSATAACGARCTSGVTRRGRRTPSCASSAHRTTAPPTVCRTGEAVCTCRMVRWSVGQVSWIEHWCPMIAFESGCRAENLRVKTVLIVVKYLKEKRFLRINVSFKTQQVDIL